LVVDPGIAALLFDAIANMRGTRILVTHAIHLVPNCDYIITMHDGDIAERGTFDELKAANGPFARLMREFANDSHKEAAADEEGEAIEEVTPVRASLPRERMTASLDSTLMSSEQIHSGNMGSGTYSGWLKAANGWVTVPGVLTAVACSQALTIITSYWLVYWQEDRFQREYSFYEGLYVLLGVASAFALFIMGSVQALATFNASVKLHDRMITRIMHAPSAWFDTTPMGRILNRLTKDIDTLDNTLGDALRMLVSTAANIVGAIVLISIVEPYFLIAVFGVFVIYGQLAFWYQKSALAFKRIDGVLRSPLYAHFSESLAGVAVIRSFDANQRFVEDNCRYMSIENRAYYLTIVNQRWLGIRLDFLGSTLTFIVGIIVIVGTSRVSPAQGGLILSYMITVQQSFSWLCRQCKFDPVLCPTQYFSLIQLLPYTGAEVNNDMASAERVLEYAQDLDQEAPHQIAETKPPANWPAEGRIQFDHVRMGYRPELPDVLKDLSLNLRPAEKVAVVGRTGAGKSTIMSTLYRLIELRSGSIKIDDGKFRFHTYGARHLLTCIASISRYLNNRSV
jgi:ABC-type multidrug transport system fused ATPase/permease subunit